MSALAQKSAMRPDAEQSRWDNRVLGDRLVLAHLYSAEPAQRCGRQYAVRHIRTQRPGRIVVVEVSSSTLSQADSYSHYRDYNCKANDQHCDRNNNSINDNDEKIN